MQAADHIIDGDAEPSDFIVHFPDRQGLIEILRSNPPRRSRDFVDRPERFRRQREASENRNSNGNRDEDKEDQIEAFQKIGKLRDGIADQKSEVSRAPKNGGGSFATPLSIA